MVDDETLIHYIRVLSELSGQLRYAAQKRVLVEVALVKLCKPQMEQNLESVLERLRILEEKNGARNPDDGDKCTGEQETAVQEAPERPETAMRRQKHRRVHRHQ